MENSTLIILGSLLVVMVTCGLILVFQFFYNLRVSSKLQKHQELEVTFYRAELAGMNLLLENYRQEFHKMDHFLHREVGSGLSVLKLRLNEFHDAESKQLQNFNTQLDATLNCLREHSKSLSHTNNSGKVLDVKLESLIGLISPHVHFAIELEKFGFNDSLDSRSSEIAYRIIHELMLRTALHKEVTLFTIIANNFAYDYFNLIIYLQGKILWDNILSPEWLRMTEGRLSDINGEVILHTSNQGNAEVVVTFPYSTNKPT